MLLFVLVLAGMGALLWSQWGWCYGREGCHHHHHNEQDNRNANLVLHDSQRLSFTSVEVIPQAGDEDIILIMVQNVDDHNVVDIAVTVEVTSAAHKRSSVAPPVVCPPLYVDNVLPFLASKASVTCRAVYTLTTADIVNDNTIYTQSMATGIVQTTETTTMAEPGMSQLTVNNVQLPEGAIVVMPGPTGPTGPVNVVSGPCILTPPHTSLVCSAANQLQLLFCDLSSNATQQGNIYMCVDDNWTFYGNAGPGSGPAGPPGVTIYSATCSGGPPPTSVTSPAFTCNAAFNLNMVMCSGASVNTNAGFVYECLCQPICAWVAVANLNGFLTWRWEWSNAGAISNLHNVWSNVNYLALDSTGTWYCTFEGAFVSTGATATCPLTVGISTVSESDAWVTNSNRQITSGPEVGVYEPITSVLTNGFVFISSAPETIYATAGIGNSPTGCGAYQIDYGGCTLRCLKLQAA